MKNANEENKHDSLESIGNSAHERLCAFVLGELEPAEAARLEVELAGSEELREEKARLEATIGFLRTNSAGTESLPPEILISLEQAAKPVPRITPWYTRTPMRAAAGFLALTAGILGGQALMEDSSRGNSIDELARLDLDSKRVSGAAKSGRDRALPDHAEESGHTSSHSSLAKDKDELSHGTGIAITSSQFGSAAKSEEAGKSPAEDAAPMAVDKLRAGTTSTIDFSAGSPIFDGFTGGDAMFLAGEEGTYTGPGDSVATGPAAATIRNEFQSLDEAQLGRLNQLGEKELMASDDFFLGHGQKKSQTLEGLQLSEYKPPALPGAGGSTQGTSLGVRVQQLTPPNNAAEPRLAGKQYDDSSPKLHFARESKNKAEATIGLVRGETATPETHDRYGAAARKKAPSSAATPAPSTGGGGGPSSPGPSGPATPGPGSPGPRAETRSLGESISLDADTSLGLNLETGSSYRYSISPTATADEIRVYCLERSKRLIDGCRRQEGETPSDMFFRFWGDNPFELAQIDHLSTFGVDVDTASYTLARRYLQGGNLPTKAQIRTEEFVNYFKPDIAAPTEGVFAIDMELVESRFGNAADAPSQRWMLRVGVRGREVAKEERKPLSLTFVIDTSGSMKDGGRLELVKHAVRLLVSQLSPSDSIALVGFNNSASVLLPMTSAQNRGIIEAAIYALHPDGGTNAEGGLKLGYEVASAGLTANAHNRVVLLSDGVANIGQVDQDRINGDVTRHRESGIYLNTIGVGMSNHNDAFLEQLANKGDGICNYVDSPVEARRALVENFTGAFEPIARDVKIQVEFDKNQVYRYRLLGYENRAIADADFRNDAVDAGEVGAGHQVVALYELEMTGHQTTEPMAKVNLRWKEPSGAGRDPREDSATEISSELSFASAKTWEGASLGYRRSVLVAQFAELLRRSVHARGDSLDELVRETIQLANHMNDSDLVEFLTLLQTSRDLIVQQAPRNDELTMCIDEIRRNRILWAQYEALAETEDREAIEKLQSANQVLEQRIQDLIRRELEKSQGKR